jgi:hypothetical protein
MFRKISLSVAVLLLAGCAALQGNFAQRLAGGYQTTTEVRQTTATLLDARRISSEQGRNVLAVTDQAREILDDAASGDERGLDLALEVLRSVERYNKEAGR